MNGKNYRAHVLPTKRVYNIPLISISGLWLQERAESGFIFSFQIELLESWIVSNRTIGKHADVTKGTIAEHCLQCGKPDV